MKKVLIYGGIAVVIAAIAYFGYKAYKKGKIDPTSGAGSQSATPQTSATSGKPVLQVATVVSSNPQVQKAAVR